MNKILKGFKVELDVNNAQRTLLLQHAGCARFACNWALAKKKEAFEKKEKIPNAIELHRELNKLKQTEIGWMYNSSKVAPQSALINCDLAFKNFFTMNSKKKAPCFSQWDEFLVYFQYLKYTLYINIMNLEGCSKSYNSDKGLRYSCQYHVIFTPKYRRKVLVDGVDTRLKELVLEKQEEFGYRVIEMEVMPDHVHLLLDSNPRNGIYDQVNAIKGYSSRILREEFPFLRKRIPTLWTRAKFISTVGSVSLEVIKKYIEDQKNV